MHFRIFACISVIFFAQFVSSKNYRLANSTVPTNYQISILSKLAADDFKFSGNVVISVVATDATSEIQVHAKRLEIESVDVRSANGNVISVVSFEADQESSARQFLTIRLEEKLVVDSEYKLNISYSGRLRNDSLGFYRTSYLNEIGEQVWLATTQFAPTEARHAFPCFDEPRFKATFQVNIRHPSRLRAISNMPIDGPIVDNNDGTHTTAFKETPKMSTYLVAFVISDYDKITRNTTNFRHEVHTRPNAISMAKFASENSADVLECLAEYFEGIELPLEVMKHVLITEFYFGAMENLGIVTYKEARMLIDAKYHGAREQLDAMVLMSHELSHQWFGNLVTMDWWTYVWLNEGFATLYGYYVVDMLHPSWLVVQKYQIDRLQPILALESETSLRPMSHYVEDPSSIAAQLDKIAYEKASCVLRMFEHAIGQDNFKLGILSYLKNAQYGTVTEDDLFAALNASTNHDIAAAMVTWTSQIGYPLVSVIFNPETRKLQVRQERFFLDRVDSGGVLWQIPITFALPNKSESIIADFWLTEQTRTYEIPADIQLGESDWILVNLQQSGYYRVNYNIENWRALVATLVRNLSAIHPQNRAQLIDDSFALAKAHKLQNYSISLAMLEFLSEETDYAPWAAFEANIALLHHMLAADEYEIFGAYLRSFLTSALRKIGFIGTTNELPLRKLTRSIILKSACTVGVEACVDNQRNYNTSDLRASFYCNRMRVESDAVFFDMLDVLRSSSDSVVRADVLDGFGCTSDREKISLLLGYVREEPSQLKLTATERQKLLQGLYQQNKVGFELVLRFLEAEKDTLPRLLSGFGATVADLAKYVNGHERGDKLRGLLNRLALPEEFEKIARKNLQTSLEWNIRHRRSIRDWLTNWNETRRTSGAVRSLTSTLASIPLAIFVFITSRYFSG